MKIYELYTILAKENTDSEIVAMSIVVKDSNSGELTNYFVDSYDGLNSQKLSL